jgi:hypothetical protein
MRPKQACIPFFFIKYTFPILSALFIGVHDGPISAELSTWPRPDVANHIKANHSHSATLFTLVCITQEHFFHSFISTILSITMKATSVIFSLMFAAASVSAEQVQTGSSAAFSPKVLKKDLEGITRKVHDASLNGKNSKKVQENAHDLEALLKMLTQSGSEEVAAEVESENESDAKAQKKANPLDFLAGMADPSHPLNLENMGKLFKNLPMQGKPGNIADMLQGVNGADFGLDSVDFDKIKGTMQSLLGASGAAKGFDMSNIGNMLKGMRGMEGMGDLEGLNFESLLGGLKAGKGKDAPNLDFAEIMKQMEGIIGNYRNDARADEL